MTVNGQRNKRTLTTACVWLGVLTACANAQNIDTARLFKQDSPAVVLIITQKSGIPIGEGSGALVTKDGTILSALHVVQGGDSAVVKLKSGDVYDKVSVVAFDARRDLVVMKIPGFHLPVLPLGDSNDVKEGDPVATISNPEGLERSISQGIVSAVRDIGDLGFKVIQTTAAASPGSSGGAILNANGELIALLSFKVVGGENLNFGIPVNYARGMLDNHETFPLSQLAARIGQESIQPPSQIGRTTPTDISGEWMNLNGVRFRIWVQEGHAYAQWAGSEEVAKGIPEATIICDLESEGERYNGTCRLRATSRWYDRWYMQWRSRACQEDLQIEFNKCSPTRIEGRMQTKGAGEKWSDKDKSNCGERFPLKWGDFVWIRPN
jgi:hypothetical protein